MKSMVPMHERSNGLGGGFAAYGIYPEYRDFYAFHVFFEDDTARRACEAQLRERFEIVQAEPVPVHKVPQITDVPLIWRYFLLPARQLCGLLLDGTRALSDKHARLVGRRAPVYAARLFGRTQRGDLVL